MPMANLTPFDPTQKLTALEARLAKLESVLSVGTNGDAILKSSTAVIIEAGTNLMMRGGVLVKVESGATMSLKASASFELQAAGTMTVTGALINLN